MLGGRSVWYSNDEAIPDDLEKAFTAISEKQWEQFSREEFVHDLARLFPRVWQVHPFREGNTRTVVMMMTLLRKIMIFRAAGVAAEHTFLFGTSDIFPFFPIVRQNQEPVRHR